MNRLAHTNPVLFVESIGMRTIRPRDMRRALARAANIRRGVWLEDGMAILSPGTIPIARSSLNRLLLRFQVRRAARELGYRDVAYWVFNPVMGSAFVDAEASRFIYHCVDDYAANASADRDAIRESEERVLQRADCVFVSSRPLYERMHRRHRRVTLIENVADIAHFGSARGEPPAEIARLRRPRIGYVGNLVDRKIDFALLREIAQLRPDWQFVLVGPVGHGQPAASAAALRAHTNIALLGPKPYDVLPRYVAAFDVCIIPFVANALTESSFPMKFFEFLAAGRPVVASPLPSLAPYQDLFRTAHTPSDWIEQIELTLQESWDPEAEAARRAGAVGHDWSDALNKIRLALEPAS